MSTENHMSVEAAVIEQLSSYRRIVARMAVLANYSVGAGITVSVIRQDDHLQELHRKLNRMASYMYLSKREQELETTAHSYLTAYPSGVRAQLRAIPLSGADADDDKALKEIRCKIEKVIEARTGNKNGYEAVIDRISELQELEAQRAQIDAALSALEGYKPEYAKLLKKRFIDGVPANQVAQEASITDRTLRRWQQRAILEYVRLLSA